MSKRVKLQTIEGALHFLEKGKPYRQFEHWLITCVLSDQLGLLQQLYNYQINEYLCVIAC